MQDLKLSKHTVHCDTSVIIRETPGNVLLPHNENTPMQYTEIFKVVKNENFQWKSFDIFLIFAPKHRLWVASTHNLCFGAKIRKIGIPLQSPFSLYKSRV